ncbi:MAG: selenium-dependent xanthine dehydrogenase [Defluviitaleaceae bacterium]|nr:selenium-dependent xanthine dehydrogenase [Defluviitaleaceae bacterium]MCL2837244.1 selenium-dependent xanthine dehydrogenase [Defluviitaleaceae bacterium]
MISFTVNGVQVECTDENKKLIRFLRGDLRLTSVKEGCGTGACGTCTVLIDGKLVRSCVPSVAKLAGKSIVTAEGLSAREKEVYTYCFAAAGAVQCGFCVPGMVISAKGLLDNKANPTRAEVKQGIRGNICRCTGYVKIEDAILMAAHFFRENIPVPQREFTGRVGEDFFRVDAEEKTLGTGLYADDMAVEGMVYAKALRSRYPRAKVLSVDYAEASAHPGCIRVITARDVPGNIKCGHLIQDWDALISEGGITRYVGDAIAIAVTGTQESLDEVLALIKVGYEELAPLTSPAMSLTAGAPNIHKGGNILSRQALKRGDADGAIAKSRYAVTKHYSLPFTEHAFMEPECAIAMPDGDGLLLYSGGQSVYDEQREISGLLGIPPEKIRVKSMLVGGGFGGKEDMSVQHHAALAAWLVKRPVKVRFSREESMRVHPKRHAMEIDFTAACDENGILTAVKAEIISDTGAYASLGGPVLQRACTHAGGPYNFSNIDVKGTAVYTNNPPAGAFRGFGVTQSAFAMECSLNLLAEMAGISPWEIRFRNAIRPGQVLPNGQAADESTALAECLLAVREAYERSPFTGIASSFKNSGLGVGVPDIGRCVLSVENGRIHIRSSAACIGQGMATVLIQMVCEALNVPPGYVIAETPDTSRTPNSGTTTASRQTVFSGEAAVIAAGNLRNELEKGYATGKTLEQILETLSGCEFYGEYKPATDPMGSDKPNPVSHVAYGFAAQVAELDERGRIVKVTAAYDVGTVVNPRAAQGQIEGGVVMGIGYGLTEDYPVKDGYPTAKYGTLGLIRATDAPEIETIFVKRGEQLPAAYGAKGVGELATIPTAPAIQGAYYKLDGVFRQKLPMEGTYYRRQ